MDPMVEINRGIEQLLGRASGPLHFRLVLQPIVAVLLAIRAGLKDAREGRPIFLWTFVADPASRRQLAQSGWKDIGKVCILAFVLDVVYQVMVLHTFYPVQTVIVVLVVAVLPYSLLRGPVTRIARGLSKVGQHSLSHHS